MENTILEIKNVTKAIKRKKILKNISIKIPKGEIYGLIGPNGAGKTTLMRMITGLSSITSGDIFIKEKSISTERKRALLTLGTIIEGPDMYPFFSGKENLFHFARMYPNISKKRIEEVIEIVGLTNSINKKVKNYSLGMKQRLGIAQSILHNPSLLILDEPTNGLDPAGIKEMRDYLKKIALQNNTSILISSHLLSEMELICDRIGIIKHGEMVSEHNLSEMELIKDSSKNKVTIEIQQIDEAKQILNEYNYTIDNNLLIFHINKEEVPNLIHLLTVNNVKIYEVAYTKSTLEERFFEWTGGNTID
ncbi:ABC transporter ATP-binding protein [Lacicoccus qingdaonensis]|uniref:ABC-2 type transport system ATP-binding protein n=1 Tax=Lacicoccus qingdaonensis TaxID=576118 RepID=A0A1G9G289_9BACL|nr:ABC transporter ATP-binding protein [Salinicoccus qingdaonensis]SDK94749.1 ABC-2 type transport system ATP-binding protein [Salinicoccus qingdaonensis]